MAQSKDQELPETLAEVASSFEGMRSAIETAATGKKMHSSALILLAYNLGAATVFLDKYLETFSKEDERVIGFDPESVEDEEEESIH